MHEKNTLRFWNASTGTLLRSRDFGGVDYQFALAVAPEISMVFCAGGDSAVRVVDPSGKDLHSHLHSPHGKYALAWSSRKNTLLVAGGAGQVARWQVGVPTFGDMHFGRRNLGSAQISGVAITRDGQRFLTGSRDGTVAMYDQAAIPADLTRTVVTGRGAVVGLAYSSDGRWLATANKSNPAYVIDLAAEAAKTRLEGQPLHETRLEFALDDQALVGLYGERGIGLWNRADGSLRYEFTPQSGTPVDFSFASDGKTLAVAVAEGNAAGGIELFDLESKKPLPLSLRCEGRPARIRHSPAGVVLAISYEGGKAELIDLSVSPPTRWPIEGRGCRWISFSADGRTLACASNIHNRVYFVHVATRAILGSITFTGGNARDLAWSPDGRLLAISVDEGWVDLWHVPTYRLLLQPYVSPPAEARYLRFSGDGRNLAVSHHDGNPEGNAAVAIYPLGDKKPGSAP